jgi:hypothetical protein
MNHQAEVTIDFADGAYLFRLSVKQIIELEEKCGAPFAVIHARLWGGAYSANDVVETIRLGLIGGGMNPPEAKKLTERYSVPFQYSFPVARAITGATMWGFEKSPLGKETATPEANQSASTLPNTSERQPEWGSGPMSLGEFHSGSWLQ